MGTAYNKLDIEYVKKHLKEKGYTLLSEKYIDAHTKLEMKCQNDHLLLMDWDHFSRGQRCKKCHHDTRLDEIRSSLESKGYALLTKEYKNRYQKLEYICPKGHIGKVSWTRWRLGSKCELCSRKWTIEKVGEYMEREGYQCLEKKYVNNKDKIKFRCPKGHISSMSFTHFLFGKRCGKCYIEEDKRGEKCSHWKNYSEEDLQYIERYRENVRQLSNRNFYEYYYIINPNGLPRGEIYHLDHIYSIMDGFRNNIPPEILASPINLRLLPNSINQRKHRHSDISLEELYNRHNQFIGDQ